MLREGRKLSLNDLFISTLMAGLQLYSINFMWKLPFYHTFQYMILVGIQVVGVDHRNVETPLFCREAEGRALLEECLSISEKSKGKHHPNLVPHLVNLATSYSGSKNFGEAERLLRISLQIMMKNVPPDDPAITFPMLHLAVTLYNLHRDEEAESLAADVLRIREEAFGKESLPVGKSIINSPLLILCYSCCFLSYYVYAVFLYHCCKCNFLVYLALQACNASRFHLCLDFVVMNILFYKCLTGETLDCLVSIRSRMGKDDGELVELLKRVLKIQEKAFGPESEEVMETMKKIVHYMDKLGIKDEKYPLQRRLSILRNKHKHMVKY